jgi:DNA (cytosine-5)-methyltransferase 1
MIKVGSDFSGVGAFNQALIRLGVEYKEVFACDMDKFARDTFIHNYGELEYYPTNVYDREIPSESLDIYMTSPPCQAFSLAGKRLGKEDKRGILFFNSHEFIQVNKPRFFIFENVKGLLSDDGGRTFQEWVNMLGGKSVNGVPVLFPYEESVPYHLYWQVLNAKKHGVPQNRERVFLIGIRDDADNRFQFPREEHLTKRLKDVLDDEIDEKYFVTNTKIEYLQRSEGTTFNINANILTQENPNVSRTIQNGYWKGGRDVQYIKVKSATSKGYEEAREGDSINFSVPSSETRRGRVGKGVAQTLDTSCNQGTLIKDKIRRLTPRECFRLMDFPDTFTWPVSDSQAYKQAGNSIVVNVLYKILKNLPL